MLKISTLSLLHLNSGSRSLCTNKKHRLFFPSFCSARKGRKEGGLFMRSRKTPQNERGTYTYHFDYGRKVTIKPGEEGVT